MLAAVKKDVIKHWTPIRHLVSVPKTAQQCERMIELLNSLLDEVGENQEHPLYPLIETLGTLIEDYETRTLPEPVTTPGSLFGFLLSENHLTSSDLPDIGSAQVVDELVRGVREFSLEQIKYLCRRFYLKPDVLRAV